MHFLKVTLCRFVITLMEKHNFLKILSKFYRDCRNNSLTQTIFYCVQTVLGFPDSFIFNVKLVARRLITHCIAVSNLVQDKSLNYLPTTTLNTLWVAITAVMSQCRHWLMGILFLGAMLCVNYFVITTRKILVYR